MDSLRDLIERLAAHSAAEDFDQPAVDLGFDKRHATPYPILRWTPADAAAQGERVATKLAKIAPPSLLRALCAYGPVQLHESVLEGAIGMHYPQVPLGQIEGLASYEVTGGGELPWIGEQPARGVIVRARWDDPQVIGCADLSATDEPIWLLYSPLAGDASDDDHLMPIASSYEDVLRLHLTGIDLALTLTPDAFERSLAKVRGLEPAWRPFVTQALDVVERTAAMFSDRADVHMRNSDDEDVRSPGLDDGAARVRSRVARMREAL